MNTVGFLTVGQTKQRIRNQFSNAVISGVLQNINWSTIKQHQLTQSEVEEQKVDRTLTVAVFKVFREGTTAVTQYLQLRQAC